jgi:hypothetical protein
VFFNSTFSVRSAVAWLTAEIVDARFFWRTIRVGNATDRLDGFDRFTNSAAAADVAFRTDAQDCSHGQCRNDLTFRRLCAWLEYGTRFLAFVVDAR